MASCSSNDDEGTTLGTPPLTDKTRMSESHLTVVKNTFLELVVDRSCPESPKLPRRRRASTDSQIHYGQEDNADTESDCASSDCGDSASYVSTADSQDGTWTSSRFGTKSEVQSPHEGHQRQVSAGPSDHEHLNGDASCTPCSLLHCTRFALNQNSNQAGLFEQHGPDGEGQSCTPMSLLQQTRAAINSTANQASMFEQQGPDGEEQSCTPLSLLQQTRAAINTTASQASNTFGGVRQQLPGPFTAPGNWSKCANLHNVDQSQQEPAQSSRESMPPHQDADKNLMAQGLYAHATRLQAFAMQMQTAAQFARMKAESMRQGTDRSRPAQPVSCFAGFEGLLPMGNFGFRMNQPAPVPHVQGAVPPSNASRRGSKQQAESKSGGQNQSAANQDDATPETGLVDVAKRTTVMLRHLPADLSRDSLLEMLDAEGFKASYDFVYLPLGFGTWASFGYAFVNALTPDLARKMWNHFDGFRLASWPESHVCTVSWGEPLQGLGAHIKRYRNSPVMHKYVPNHFKPVLLANGVKVDFPRPTKRIRPPRIKCSTKANASGEQQQKEEEEFDNDDAASESSDAGEVNDVCLKA